MFSTAKNIELFFEHAPDLLFLATNDGRLLSANARFRQVLGCSLENPKTRTMDQFFDRPTWAAVRSSATSGPTEESYFVLKTLSDDFIRVRGKVFVEEESNNLCGLFRSGSIAPLAVPVETQLSRRLLELGERERRLLAGEIHDGFVQHVVGAQMWLEAVREALPDGDDDALAAVKVVRESMLAAMDDARQMINRLRPVTEDEVGLELGMTQLLHELRQRTDAQILVETEGALAEIHPLIVAVALRITQEALLNSIRHSQATTIRVAVSREPEKIAICIEDDGIGFDPSEVAPGRLGLPGIRLRAEVLAGRVEVSSLLQKGTTITVRLPLQPIGEA